MFFCTPATPRFASKDTSGEEQQDQLVQSTGNNRECNQSSTQSRNTLVVKVHVFCEPREFAHKCLSTSCLRQNLLKITPIPTIERKGFHPEEDTRVNSSHYSNWGGKITYLTSNSYILSLANERRNGSSRDTTAKGCNCLNMGWKRSTAATKIMDTKCQPRQDKHCKITAEEFPNRSLLALEQKSQTLEMSKIISLILGDCIAHHIVHPSLICSTERSVIIFAASENNFPPSGTCHGSKFNHQQRPCCPWIGINKRHQ